MNKLTQKEYNQVMLKSFQYNEDHQIKEQGKYAWIDGNSMDNCPYKDPHRKSIWIIAFKEARKQSLNKKVEISENR